MLWPLCGTVRIPQRSLLCPSRTAAVCGGNVLTSQRIVDVVLKAFHACAASQGCTNNLTFGAGGKASDASGRTVAVAGWGYYETIAGGSGAGPGWHGTSGVHTHITNTRIGDVEILERRYPLVVRRFGLRDGSNGKGKWRGGEGVVRELEFTEGLQVSILSEVSLISRPFSSSFFSSVLGIRGLETGWLGVQCSQPLLKLRGYAWPRSCGDITGMECPSILILCCRCHRKSVCHAMTSGLGRFSCIR